MVNVFDFNKFPKTLEKILDQKGFQGNQRISKEEKIDTIWNFLSSSIEVWELLFELFPITIFSLDVVDELLLDTILIGPPNLYASSSGNDDADVLWIGALGGWNEEKIIRVQV